MSCYYERLNILISLFCTIFITNHFIQVKTSKTLYKIIKIGFTNYYIGGEESSICFRLDKKPKRESPNYLR